MTSTACPWMGVLAASDFSMIPYVAGGLIIWLGVQILSTIIVARVLKAQMEGVVLRVGHVEKRADGHDEKIAALDRERAACELRSSRAYATRGELVRVIVDQTALSNQLFTRIDEFQTSMRDSVGKVHTRVDEAVKELFEIKGQLFEREKERGRGAPGPEE